MRLFLTILLLGVQVLAANAAPDLMTINAAAVATLDPCAETAARVLAEEVNRRTGGGWRVVDQVPDNGAAVTLAVDAPLPAEGYRVQLQAEGGEAPRVHIEGAGARGVLYGVGALLRVLDWGPDGARLPAGLRLESAPAYPLRGHQLGYRPKANSYDAWTPEQYDRHIRELALFGANAIENIPFHQSDSVHMPVSRREMNAHMSHVCAKYGLEYWVWTPANFDLADTERRREALDTHAALYEDCERLDAVFFPGGDPGHNPPSLVLPFLADLAPLLTAEHPDAQLWLSLQGFSPDATLYTFNWIEEHQPEWLGGLVAGPSSPPIPGTRKNLPARYGLRHYPDITHTVRCQYPVKWWDTAFAVTLGREPINPQPEYYAAVHNALCEYTTGFIAYSDGAHDDVNKVIWLARGWDPEADVRDVLIQYARLFFGAAVAEEAADGILALEENWEGPLRNNGQVTATLRQWQRLEEQHPELADNWRWQMCLVRAYYDAYTRYRLIYERGLEAEACARLGALLDQDPEAAMRAALEMVRRADQTRVRPDLRKRVVHLFDALFHSIGLQSSVDKYQADGYERGCSLDFLDYPLNNRWWYEDEFKRIAAMEDLARQRQRLRTLATWANPESGSFYDNIGQPGMSPHVVRGQPLAVDPLMRTDPNPGSWWWDQGFSRERLSSQMTLDFPKALRYRELDPDASYVLRLTGYGDAKVRADGELLEPTVYGKEIGEFKVFPVPPAVLDDGEVEFTFDPLNEGHLNWRQQSRVSGAWLLKQ